MTKIKIEIKNRWTGKVLFEYEKDENTMKDTVMAAVEARADLTGAVLTDADLRGAVLRGAVLRDADLRDAVLRGAHLRGAVLRGAVLRDADLRDADLTDADLRGAVLRGAVLRGADLTGADLTGAVLTDADLRGADLTDADLTDADLTPIKDDFFAVLIRSLPEIEFLRKNIVEGNINGSTYDGDCACLSGTLANGAKKHNGPQMDTVVKNIMSCRNASRPIERFFLSIAKGDTPETNQFSKLALEWLDEFMFYMDSFRPEAEQKAKQKA